MISQNMYPLRKEFINSLNNKKSNFKLKNIINYKYLPKYYIVKYKKKEVNMFISLIINL